MILSEYEWQAIILSLKVSGVAVVCSLPLGILMAWILVRCRFPGKSLLDSIIHLPLVLPPVVIGYLLLISMGRHGFAPRVRAASSRRVSTASNARRIALTINGKATTAEANAAPRQLKLKLMPNQL